MNKKLLASVVAAAGLAVCSFSSSFAAAPTRVMAPCADTSTHWYAGIGLNYNATNKEHAALSIYPYADTKPLFKLKNNSLGFNIFAGQRLGKHWGHEVGFSWFGESKWKAQNNDGSDYSILKTRSNWHLYYDGYFYVPFASFFEIFAKGGVGYYNLENQFKYPDLAIGNVTEKLSTFALNYGFGAQFNFQQFGVRGSYTQVAPAHHINSNFINNDYIALDALYHFV